MNIVTIMNFVRGCEPRCPDLDLMAAPIHQNELNKKYGFPNTFLLQYDAIINPAFSDFFKKEKDDNMELGVWIEIVRPLVEQVGIEWRGREGYDWDWYVNPGFLMAYTQSQKELLIDELMNKFKEVFGYYPKTAASWLIDAYSAEYMTKKYGITTLGICREQMSVDAYTLWGGPYNQPYYPSKNNILCPAQSNETKINTPVFRLLGIEPIRGYFEKIYADSPECYGCATMEPVWKYGQQKEYMDWFFKTYFENENMGIAYTQIGQENSFGWQSMEHGLKLQYEMLKKYSDAGKISLMKMSEAGEYFKSAYSDTPSQAITADTDAVADDFYRSVWFSNKYYRANVFINRGTLGFRDIQKFDDQYRERYLDEPCTSWDAVYDNLPICDERSWTSDYDNAKAGISFEGLYEFKTAKRIGNGLKLTFERNNGETVNILLSDNCIDIISESNLIWTFGDFKDYKINSNSIEFTHNNYNYKIDIAGTVTQCGGKIIISGKDKKILF